MSLMTQYRVMLAWLLVFSPVLDPVLAQQTEQSSPAQTETLPQTEQFSPEPGYSCARDKQRCWKQEQLNFYMTRIQFGDAEAIELLQETPQVVDLEGIVFYPDADVSCDFSIQVCYHQLQASRPHTEQYFSVAAALQLDRFLALLDNKAAEFEPKRGASCVRSASICYDQRGPSLGLTRLFFGHSAATRLLGGLLKHQAAKE